MKLATMGFIGMFVVDQASVNLSFINSAIVDLVYKLDTDLVTVGFVGMSNIDLAIVGLVSLPNMNLVPMGLKVPATS